jgi:hypothetical protein
MLTEVSGSLMNKMPTGKMPTSKMPTGKMPTGVMHIDWYYNLL